MYSGLSHVKPPYARLRSQMAGPRLRYSSHERIDLPRVGPPILSSSDIVTRVPACSLIALMSSARLDVINTYLCAYCVL